MIELYPLSMNARRSIRDSKARINIWHGSVRSSKTFVSVLRFLDFLCNTSEGAELAIFGRTIKTVERNITNQIRELIGEFPCSIHKGEATILNRKVYLFGADKEPSETKIRGATFHGAYGDEMTLIPESFFKTMMTRLSVEGAKLFGTCNPDSPFHWLKKDYIDNDRLDLKHFSFKLEDNLGLDKEYIKAIKNEFSGMFYKRFIDGEWCMADGVIYDMFNYDLHVSDKLPPDDHDVVEYIGIDYGTNNPTVFLNVLHDRSDNRIYIVEEYYYDSTKTGRQKTDKQYVQDLKRFIGIKNIKQIIVDPSCLSLKAEMRDQGLKRIVDGDNRVIDGIRNVSTHFQQNLVSINPMCKYTIGECGSYIWDAKAQLKGEDKPIKAHDHCLDNFRYVVMHVAPLQRTSIQSMQYSLRT